MFGLGTIVNTVAIAIGGILGLVVGRRFTERYQKTVVAALSMSVMFVGIAGTLQEMFKAGADGRLTTHGALMLVVSMAGGAIIGEWLDLDARFEALGMWIRRVTHSEGDGNFTPAAHSSRHAPPCGGGAHLPAGRSD